MSLIDQPSLLVSMGNWLQRQDIAAIFPDFITLFETTANRRLRVRQMEIATTLIPSVVATITGAASNGSANYIRLAVPSAGMTNGDQVVVAGVTGTTEANGSWPIAVIDSGHIDLITSVFTNAYVSGGTVTDVGNVPLPSDFLAWRTLTWEGNPARDLQYEEPSLLTIQYPSSPVDLPTFFSIEASTIRVMPQDPTPLTLLYWQKIPALTATNTTNWLMTAYPDIYLFGSLVEAAAYARNPDDIPLWKTRRDELFDEIDRLDKKARGPTAVRIVGPTP
jgi:hypothetical protein